MALAQIGLSPVAIEKNILWQAPIVHAIILLKASLLVCSSIAAFTAVKSLPITISSALRSTGSLFVLVGSLVTMGVLPKTLQLVGLLLGVTSLLIYSWPSSRNGPPEAQPRFILLMFLAVITAASSLVIDKFLIVNHGINGRSIQF